MEWKDNKPTKLAQKARDTRWMVTYSKAKPKKDGMKPIDITIPHFGYKNHISIDCRYGIIRREMTTAGAASDGARVREGLIDPKNTASDAWADTA